MPPTDWLKEPKPRNNRAWPWDQSYAGQCNCGAMFFGPKRAPMCWECAPEDTRSWWLAKFHPPPT